MNSAKILGGRVTVNLPDTNVTRAPVAALIPSNRAEVAGVYSDADCLTAYSTGAVKNDHLFFKLASAQKGFNVGAKLSAWDTSDEAASNLTPMTVVGQHRLGGITQVNLTAAYTDAAFSTAYTGSATAAKKVGDILYLKLASGSTAFGVGQVITTYDASHPTIKTRMQIIAIETLTGPVDGLTVSLLDDDASPYVNAADNVFSYQGGGQPHVIEVVLNADDAAPMLDGANYLYHSDTKFNGSLIHAWAHSGDMTTVELYQKVATGLYSPNLLGAEANWSTPVSSDLSPSTPKFLIEAELYVTSTCDNGTVLELVIDPWVMGHRL